jgi:hypothetical protein
MKAKTIFLVCLCFVLIICGLIYLTSQMIARKKANVMLLFAKQNYPSGTTITDPEKMFEFREIFERDEPLGSCSELEALRGLTLIKDISEGQPLDYTYVEDNRPKTLGPGNQEFLLRCKGRWGLIQAGKRVDLICRKSEGNPHADAKILLRNILVRVVERQTPDDGDRTELVPLYVVVEVTREEALLLYPFQKEHGNTFEVRPAGDDKKSDSNKGTKGP